MNQSRSLAELLEQRITIDLSLKNRARMILPGIPSGATAPLIRSIAGKSVGPVMVISHRPEELVVDLQTWGGEGEDDVFFFPGLDTLPFDRVPPSEDVIKYRMRALHALSSGGSPIIVAPPEAMVRASLSTESFQSMVLHLKKGQTLRRDAVIARLVQMGYKVTSVVTVPGEVAIRGGIVDVYPTTSLMPVRVEWDGSLIDDLRLFRESDQVARVSKPEVSILPRFEADCSPSHRIAAVERLRDLPTASLREDVAKAWLKDLATIADDTAGEALALFVPALQGEEGRSVLSFAASGTVVIDGDLVRLSARATTYLSDMRDLRDREVQHGELVLGFPDGLIETPLDALLPEDAHVVELRPHLGEDDRAQATLITPSPLAGTTQERMNAVVALARNGTVCCITRQAERLSELIEQAGSSAIRLDALDIATSLPTQGVVICDATLCNSLGIPDAKLCILSDFEIFGQRTRREALVIGRGRGHRSVESSSDRGIQQASSGRGGREGFALPYTPGDYVVHRDHGIGRFKEMRHIEEDGAEHEFMVIEYHDGDTLFVPVTHLDRVDRYVGGGDAKPQLSRLGTKEWERTKRKATENAEAVARALISLYSKREMTPGHAFPEDGAWQRELEDAFPYEETEDQLTVLDDIKRDMEAPKSMDRLVCGDVGFGKTELAIRAAFKAVSDGYQVAVLVPTTVLAQQHFRTFTERLNAFPVTIRQLSRLCSDEEVSATIGGMALGTVDIVIGTHRLISKDVRFKNLGFVVIDEEQRFGVLQKERLKELRLAVDVLSLSATPIPRTLHMALSGLRDLSVIRTPPEERQPIRTYVTVEDDDLISQVITRELSRDGQVYVVHNRVATIIKEQRHIELLVPHAHVGIAHGQMQEQDLASVMDRFMAGEINVLVCSTIIESGLDIPNVNTIIIQDSNRLGLAQLYQLRGRVGRSGRRAYAYLLYPPTASLTEQADKRLDAIESMQDLGSGFTLAMRDLEIRGAGNILGAEQHGEIAAVGLELYNHMLHQSIMALKGTPLAAELPAMLTVRLPLDAYIPHAYMTDAAVRLRCYQELSGTMSERALTHQREELRDRFGPLPIVVENLLYVLLVRLLAAATGVLSIDSSDGAITLTFPQQTQLPLDTIVRQFGRSVTASQHRIFLHPPGVQFPPPVPDELTQWQTELLTTLRSAQRHAKTTPQVAAPAGAQHP